MLRALIILFLFLFAPVTFVQAQDRDQHIRDQLFDEAIEVQVVMICNSYGLEKVAMVISSDKRIARYYCVRYFGMLNGQEIEKVKVIEHKHIAENQYIFWVQIKRATDPHLGSIDLVLIRAEVSRGA